MARDRVMLSAPPGARLIAWRPAVLAGLAGGLAFLILQLFLTLTVGGESPWGPVRMIAAIAMGSGVLPPPATFDLAVLLVALVVHFALAMAYGVVFAFIVHRWHIGLWRWSAAVGAAVGGLCGILLYGLNFYAFTQVFPWFGEARSFVTLFDHIVFGAVTGVAYGKLARSEREARPSR